MKLKIFQDKKGMEQMWWIIAGCIIALLVVIFVIIWFKGSGEKAFGSIGEQLDDLGDCDKDNVADIFDKCKCDPAYGETLPEGGSCGKTCTGKKEADCIA